MNLRPCTPPITKENAADYARRATISRENNRAARLIASLPERATGRAVVQVNKVLTWMEKEKDKDEYAKLASILDRLWNMAYPKAGVMRPRSPGQRRTAPSAEPAPQAPQT